MPCFDTCVTSAKDLWIQGNFNLLEMGADDFLRVARLRAYARTPSRNPNARHTRLIVSNRGCESGRNAL